MPPHDVSEQSSSKIVPIVSLARGGQIVGGGEGTQEKNLTAVQFIILLVQLALLALVIRQFQIESSAFLRIALLTFVGFAIHAVLPLPYRLPFFVALSLGGIGMVFGIPGGLWLVGIGLTLIGICHLPLSYRLRVLLLLLAGIALAFFRVEWLHAPWPQAIWPILGSMFMFRLMVYLYDLQHDKVPASFSRTLAYFFLLPNVCFPLFPVVDYKTFRRTYYDDAPYAVYQRGIDWMTRGIIHLILYRVIYYYFTLAPAEVTGAAELFRFLLANFLLYLRISGLFHLIVGMLHLFGFHLPETHHRYYFASSFTDYWRRINIYWKDFMLKLFYYPAYFKLRRWGNTTALVGATLFVFIVTWFLHAYQWFWLRGSFLLTWPDVLFWTILAFLVLANSLYEAWYPKSKTLGKASWTFRSAAGLTAQTAGTFITLCLLWSLWTSTSVGAWISLLASAQGVTTANLAVLIPVLVVATVLRGASQDIRDTSPILGVKAQQKSTQPPPQQEASLSSIFSQPEGKTFAALILLVLLGIPAVYSRFGADAASVIHALRSGKLSRLDTALLERGYYEDLLTVDRFNSQLWEVYMNRPVKWLDAQGLGAERFTNNFLQYELVPSFASFASGVQISINRWGMRDQEYEQIPPPNSYRIALLGASTVMGWGVGDGKTFEALLEQRLNREHTPGQYAKYEILNFAVPGYEPLQQRMMLEKALTFSPQAVFYIAPGREAALTAQYLAEVVRKKVEIPYSYLRDLVQRAGLHADMEETETLRRLEPFQSELLTWLYREIVQECRTRNIQPVWIFLPQVYAGSWQAEVSTIRQLAIDTGFTVIDLGSVYDGYDLQSLRLAEWDNHPNAQAHELIATRLYTALRENPGMQSLKLVSAAYTPATTTQTKEIP